MIEAFRTQNGAVDRDENVYDPHPHTSASIAFEDFYLTALKTAKKRKIKRNVTNVTVSEELQTLIENAGERLGIRKMQAFEYLSSERKTIFLQTFNTLYQDYLEQDKEMTAQIEQLFEEGHIPYEYINPDGTFDAKQIQESPYFLDNHRRFGQFEFGTRQLKPDNKHVAKAKVLYAEQHAGHDHKHEEHHDHESDACCPTHRKKEISLLRTQRKYGNYPRLAKAISKVKELGWLLLCPGDDIANLANTVVTPLLFDGDSDDHHHKEPDAYVPRVPFSVVHEATEVFTDNKEWEIVDFKSAKVSELADHHHSQCSHNHEHEQHHHEHEHNFDWRSFVDPVHARLLYYSFSLHTITTEDVIPQPDLANATIDHLDPLLQTANEMSLESRKESYKNDGMTFEERNKKWNKEFCEGVLNLIDETTEFSIQTERIKALQSVGIDITEASRENVSMLSWQVELFRRTYVDGVSSDIGRFVADIAKKCTSHDGSVDLTILGLRLQAIEPMLRVFGTTNDVHLLVKDFAIAHGILLQKGSRKKEVLQYANEQLAQNISEQDAIRLSYLHLRYIDIEHIEYFANTESQKGELVLAS